MTTTTEISHRNSVCNVWIFAELSAIENVLDGWNGCVEFSWNRTRILKLTRQRFTDFATRPTLSTSTNFFVLKLLEG